MARGTSMIKEAIESYLSVRRSVGFELVVPEYRVVTEDYLGRRVQAVAGVVKRPGWCGQLTNKGVDRNVSRSS